MILRGTTSSSRICSAVRARPWVSTKPTTTSVPRAWRRHASLSIANVFPTPGAAPRYTRRLPRAIELSGAIECEIQFQHVHSLLPEKSPRAPLRVGIDCALHGVKRHVALARHSGRLEPGVLHGDLRVEPGGRRRDGVHRYLRLR